MRGTYDKVCNPEGTGMQQQIGFCSTTESVRIAYAIVGTGPALVVAEPRFSHLGLEWEEPRIRDFWQTIGRHHTVVRYDTQGCGFSDRNRRDFSLDSEIQPIDAVVNALGLDSFALWGRCFGAAPAIAYPREEFHVLSLSAKGDSKQAGNGSAESGTKEQAMQSNLNVGRMGDAGEMLDAKTKAAYKHRIAELRARLEEARDLNKNEMIDELEDESEVLSRELARAVGLGGRDRRAASASERARINITRAIKISLEKIAEHNPALASLLASSVRTGTFCIYTPDSRLPTSWQL
jgi:hypothetical protein